MERDEAIGMLKSITAGFDRHDLDGILAHFLDDAVYESPRGPEPWGQRYVGKEEIRGAFAGRFSGIPDVRYRDRDISSKATVGPPNGPCPVRRHPDSGSRFAAATFGRYGTARSRRRTRSGRFERSISPGGWHRLAMIGRRTRRMASSSHGYPPQSCARATDGQTGPDPAGRCTRGATKRAVLRVRPSWWRGIREG